MTKAELLAAARIKLYDIAVPYLWSDDELTDFITEAEAEAAFRASLIEVAGVSAYCDITLADDTSTYAMDTLVYDVLRARVSGESYFLKRTSREKLDELNPAWGDIEGTPTHYYITDTSITFYPQPTEAGTVNLVVLRLPVSPMSTSPEINARHHRGLLDWVCKQAYAKRASDSGNIDKSRYHERQFEKTFGPRFDEKQLTRQRKRTPTTMKDNPYGTL